MFAALDKENNLVYAKLEVNNRNKYKCIDCGKRVRLVQKKNKNNYFCHISEAVDSNNETDMHKLAKMKLKQDFERIGYNTNQEIYTKNDQRIDLLATRNNVKIAVEFQNSSISVNKLNDRVVGYYQSGYRNFWILSMNYFKKRMSARQLKFLNFNYCWNWYLVFLDTKLKKYILLYEIEFCGILYSIRYKKKTFFSLHELFSFKNSQKNNYLLAKKNPTDNFKKFCYQNRINYQNINDQDIVLPPIMKDNLISTLVQYQKGEALDKLIELPSSIKIKPQLTQEVLTEVRNNLDYLLVLIER